MSLLRAPLRSFVTATVLCLSVGLPAAATDRGAAPSRVVAAPGLVRQMQTLGSRHLGAARGWRSRARNLRRTAPPAHASEAARTRHESKLEDAEFEALHNDAQAAGILRASATANGPHGPDGETAQLFVHAARAGRRAAHARLASAGSAAYATPVAAEQLLQAFRDFESASNSLYGGDRAASAQIMMEGINLLVDAVVRYPLTQPTLAPRATEALRNMSTMFSLAGVATPQNTAWLARQQSRVQRALAAH